VTVYVFDGLRDCMGRAQIDVRLNPGTTLAGLFRYLADQYDERFLDARLRRPGVRSVSAVLLNGQTLHLPRDLRRELEGGDVLHLIPPHRWWIERSSEMNGTGSQLLQLLAARAESGNPLRVGLIGAGKFGTMFLGQARRVRGLHVWNTPNGLLTRSALKQRGLASLDLVCIGLRFSSPRPAKARSRSSRARRLKRPPGAWLTGSLPKR